MVLVPSATAGGVPLVLARLVEGLSTHQCAGGPWRLEDRRNCSQVSPCAGRLPSGRGPNADRPSMSWATSTARPHRRCHVDNVEYHCGFQGVRGGAREAVAMVTRRRISTKERSGTRFSAASSGCRPS